MPFFDYVIYPLFAKIGIFKKQLQRISVGLLFAILSFSVATILESQIQTKSIQLNPINRIKLINLSPCNLNIQTENAILNLNGANKQEFTNTNTNLNETIFNLNSNCSQTDSEIKLNNNNLPFALIFYMNDDLNKLDYFIYAYDINNEKVGFSEIKFISVGLQDTELIKPILSNNIQTYSKDLNFISSDDLNISNASYSIINYANYDLKIINNTNNEILLNQQILLETGSRYTVLLYQLSVKKFDYFLLIDIYSNGLNITLQSIQIFLMCISEILVTVSGRTFAYEEAPASMKSLMQALWILTTSIGNFIIVIVAEANIGTGLILENIIYIILLVIATVLFFTSAHFYKCRL